MRFIELRFQVRVCFENQHSRTLSLNSECIPTFGTAGKSATTFSTKQATHSHILFTRFMFFAFLFRRTEATSIIIEYQVNRLSRRDQSVVSVFILEGRNLLVSGIPKLR